MPADHMATNVALQEQKGIADVRAKRINGFSLMEMMVVLLIVAIIAAASAPMVTKKLSRNAGTGDSPWVFTGLNNNIAYLGDNSGQVLIGAANRPASADHAMLYIAGRNNWEHIAFGNSNNTDSMGITANPGQRSIGINRINNNLAIPQTSVMFGMNQTLNANNYSGIVAIGDSTVNGGSNSVAVGIGANASNSNTIAVGPLSVATSSGAIAIGTHEDNNTGARGSNSIAIGNEARATNTGAISIGAQAQNTGAEGENSIVIGTHDIVRTGASAENSIAIGTNAWAITQNSIAIGQSSEVETRGSIAIGSDALVTGIDSIAIGNASATSDYSVAIGNGAQTTATNQIVLGTSSSTVYIPGDLVVGQNVILNCKGVGYQTLVHYRNKGHLSTMMSDGSDYARTSQAPDQNGPGDALYQLYKKYSDRRLKNVGEKYTAGLAELKKLDFFHYTFKKDEEKTPHVGVMAQDLQKVFPDAVTKGEDGYLQIRFEDMFYAVINAVKELDNKITEIVRNITDMRSTTVKQAEINEEQSKTIAEQQKTIEQQQKAIEEQQQLIKNLEKRIEKLED